MREGYHRAALKPPAMAGTFSTCRLLYYSLPRLPLHSFLNLLVQLFIILLGRSYLLTDAELSVASDKVDMSSEPILIIGAGLGGLALAQALRKQDIPFRIFERDPEHGAREQGWAISLHQWLMTDMCSSIRDDEAGLRASAPTAPLGLPSEGIIYSLADGQRKKLFSFGEKHEQSFVRVERAKLRDWLLQGVSVEWGKKCTEYQEDADSVTARFADGTEARGRILIGADGVSSHGMSDQ